MKPPLTKVQRDWCRRNPTQGWARTVGDWFDDGEEPQPADLHGGLDDTETLMSRWVMERSKHRSEAMRERAAWFRSKR